MHAPCVAQVSFPLAMLVLAVMLRSARLLLLPMLNMAVVVIASFTIMYPVGQRMEVTDSNRQ